MKFGKVVDLVLLTIDFVDIEKLAVFCARTTDAVCAKKLWVLIVPLRVDWSISINHSIRKG